MHRRKGNVISTATKVAQNIIIFIFINGAFHKSCVGQIGWSTGKNKHSMNLLLNIFLGVVDHQCGEQKNMSMNLSNTVCNEKC